MQEYKVKITEIRYEYIEAKSADGAIKKAKGMILTNADEFKCEIVEEECFDNYSEFENILDNGRNIKMKNIAGCVANEDWTLDDCEKNCLKYYGCYSVSLAHDILKEYEKVK